jgi:hypothetical protein
MVGSLSHRPFDLWSIQTNFLNRYQRTAIGAVRKSILRTPSSMMKVSSDLWIVPDEVALQLHDLDRVIVHLGDDLRLPLFVE